MEKTNKNGRGDYPWQSSSSGMELRAVSKGMEWRFPYRVVTVRRTKSGAVARIVTMAPTWPPAELSNARSKTFASIDEAMAWAEGVYDEALGLA